MLKIDGKTFMNIQEAVQWLLDNNALPFQSTANYIANTEIGMGTIVNPSPAKVRIGSLIFFADSKVSTVTGLTGNGFIVSDQYNNLVDDIAYVTNVAINASGHLITTLSDGQTIDAGQIKQVSGFSIDGSQHLIVSYNDGSTTDLGAIFSGNVNIAGNLTADSIIENMTGYTFDNYEGSVSGLEIAYAGVVKNGNKLTFVVAGNVIKDASTPYNAQLGRFNIPLSVAENLFPLFTGTNSIDARTVAFFNTTDMTLAPYLKNTQLIRDGTYHNLLTVQMNGFTASLTEGVKYIFRYETTFLLSPNLA